MGREVKCQIDRGTESFSGRALLESDHLILRGPTTRLILRFSEIQTATADEGLLSLTTSEEVVLLHLGRAAAKWLDQIKNPRTRMEKVGVKSGDRVGIHGEIDPDFLAELRARAAEFPESGPFDWIFLVVETPSQLSALHDLADQIAPAGAVWVVAPKGKGSPVHENEIRSAGLAAGLVDTKVVGFSHSRTALKFVIPKARRPNH